MSHLPSDLKYLSSHEWLRIESDGTAFVGITDHAQEQMGDLVYVECPEVGSELGAGDEAGVVESVKAASSIYSPVSGQVLSVNSELEGQPELVNQSAESDGWIVKIKVSDPTEVDSLLDSADYQASLG